MKLIIIGNGFDLHCELKSSFIHFFEKKMKNEQGKYDPTKIRSNIWYLLFYFRFIKGTKDGVCKLVERDNVLWMDIESFISHAVSDVNGVSIGRPMSTIQLIFRDKPKCTKNIDELNFVMYGNYSEQRDEIISLINKNAKTNNAYTFLMDELKRFENDFSQYLLEEKSQNVFYKQRVNRSLIEITKKGSAFLIDFNYTNIDEFEPVLFVHGSLEEGNVIIGADASSLVQINKNTLRFTKAWRKLSINSKSIKIPGKESVNEIVFYGHSLGQQDYSYFHTIFNYYDIYSSNVVLTFLYSDYEYLDEKKTHPDFEKNERNRLKYIDNIFSLLRNYVEQTLNNVEANTVITKMQLENRLRIMEFREYAYS